MNKRIACIDLDGTLASYKKWDGESSFGDVIEGASIALKKLREENWILIIHTTRTNIDAITNFLNNYDIPFDYINENPFQPENAIGGKLYADVYIDDRAVQFNGDWEKTIQQVLNFKSWEKRKMEDQAKIKHAENFLNVDFSQSFDQLRHYDSMIWDITKFTFIQILGSITAIWAIYAFAQEPDSITSWIAINYMFLIPSIFGMSYIFSVLASFLISRNRVYFAKVARYLNEHRNFSISQKPLGFENKTKFYTSDRFPTAFDIWSNHLVSLYIIQLLGAIIFGAMIFCILLIWIENIYWVCFLSAVSSSLSFIINLRIYIKYMKNQDREFGE